MEDISKTSKAVIETVDKPVQYGWVCPVCGRGNSPFTSTCPCKPIDWKITCGNMYTSAVEHYNKWGEYETR